MGIVLAFAVGYIVGANSGQDSYREVLDSLRAVRESEEFAGLVSAMRAHFSASLRQLADVVDDTAAPDVAPAKLIERVRTIMARPPMSPAS
jgi:hypothetical protein